MYYYICVCVKTPCDYRCVSSYVVYECKANNVSSLTGTCSFMSFLLIFVISCV